jgi:toxin HigB-1
MSQREAIPSRARARLRPCAPTREPVSTSLPRSQGEEAALGRASLRRNITLDVNDVERYASSVLRSFGDKDSERVWQRRRVKKFHEDLERVALRKLVILDAAETLADLRVPPGNRLEKLSGERIGQHSIRINDQWRICFHWTKAGPEDVEITEYH